MALHWGAVKTGPDGDVLGAEVHRIFRAENVQMQDQVEPVTHQEPLPTSERILVTSQVMEQLNEADSTKFKFAGKFRLRGFDEPCELWVLSKKE
jgi:class 3 adenylate cyclase